MISYLLLMKYVHRNSFAKIIRIISSTLNMFLNIVYAYIGYVHTHLYVYVYNEE